MEETNKLALNTFIGSGYCKMVRKAITKADGTISIDANGDPIPLVADMTQPPVHYECGYIIAFTDRFGITSIVKLIEITRGLTVLARG